MFEMLPMCKHERACYEHSKSFRFRAKKEGKKFAESFPHDGGTQCGKKCKKRLKNIIFLISFLHSGIFHLKNFPS